jgi:hypothetical protein
MDASLPPAQGDAPRGAAAASSQAAYVTLDPLLRQADPARFSALFTSFAAGYANVFEGDEAESTSEWQARIAGKAPPQPIMRIVVATDEAGGRLEVIGGVCAEY